MVAGVTMSQPIDSELAHIGQTQCRWKKKRHILFSSQRKSRSQIVPESAPSASATEEGTF